MQTKQTNEIMKKKKQKRQKIADLDKRIDTFRQSMIVTWHELNDLVESMHLSFKKKKAFKLLLTRFEDKIMNSY